MFTNITASYNNGDVLIEAACLSTDTKPTDGIANGSACIEMDTGKTFMYDEANSEWLEVNTGGGGGGGGVNLHTATLTIIGSSDTAVIGFNPYIDESTGYLDNNNDAPLVGTYTIPLFKNSDGEGGIYETSIWNNGESLSMTSSGDITIVEEQDHETGEYLYAVTITGDCTITLT